MKSRAEAALTEGWHGRTSMSLYSQNTLELSTLPQMRYLPLQPLIPRIFRSKPHRDNWAHHSLSFKPKDTSQKKNQTSPGVAMSSPFILSFIFNINQSSFPLIFQLNHVLRSQNWIWLWLFEPGRHNERTRRLVKQARLGIDLSYRDISAH